MSFHIVGWGGLCAIPLLLTEYSSQEKLWLRKNVTDKTWPWARYQVINKAVKSLHERGASHLEPSRPWAGAGWPHSPDVGEHALCLHPNSPHSSKIIGRNSLHIQLYCDKFLMVHLCLKMKIVGLCGCRIMQSYDLPAKSQAGGRCPRPLCQSTSNWADLASRSLSIIVSCLFFFLTIFCDYKSSIFSILKN